MIDIRTIDRLVIAALNEDAPWGDITAENFIPESAQISAQLIAREPGVFSGAQVLDRAFHLIDPSVEVQLIISDGSRFATGDVLATVSGSARSILRSERIGLNFVQRLSGIATLTAQYVDLAGGTRIVDTRKTTPGLRILERQAVRDGGGHNHRYSLSDAVMIKDNHLATIISQGINISEALNTLKNRLPHTTHVEVEVDRLEQIEEVLNAGVHTIMLDNFTPDELRAGVAMINGRALVEASGGVNLGTVAEIARTGVDLISVGALTHSVRALDLGLDT